MRLADHLCDRETPMFTASPDGKNVVDDDRLRQFWLSRRSEAEVLVADNVAEWRYANADKMTFEIDKDAYPAVVPPHPFMLIEWRHPKGMKTEGMTEGGVFVASTMGGAVLFANRVEEWRTCGVHSEPVQLALAEARRSGCEGWIMVLFPILLSRRDHGPQRVIQLPAVAISINSDGSCGGNPVSFIHDQGKDAYAPLARESTHFVLSTLAFANCRNATSAEVKPDAKLNKARVRRGREPLTSYRVLGIHSISRALAGEGRIATNGLSTALHLCRGHFKTFTPDRPLLGKHHGRFWWASHARGDAKNGTVVKDYADGLTDAQRAFCPPPEQVEARAAYLKALKKK